jgi:hypothetical protein
VRETQHHVAAEITLHGEARMPSQRGDFSGARTLRDPSLSSISQAGLVNNLNDGMAWGLFPLLFAAAQMNLAQIGTLAAVYPATWGVCQLVTGAWSIASGASGWFAFGMWVQAIGIGGDCTRDQLPWLHGRRRAARHRHGDGVSGHCSPRSAMSRIHRGAHLQWAFIGFGATSVMPRAP